MVMSTAENLCCCCCNTCRTLFIERAHSFVRFQTNYEIYGYNHQKETSSLPNAQAEIPSTHNPFCIYITRCTTTAPHHRIACIYRWLNVCRLIYAPSHTAATAHLVCPSPKLHRPKQKHRIRRNDTLSRCQELYVESTLAVMND